MSGAVAERKDYYRVLAECLPKEALVVTALGNASYLWAVVRDAPETAAEAIVANVLRIEAGEDPVGQVDRDRGY